jgi:hypothetical protein
LPERLDSERGFSKRGEAEPGPERAVAKSVKTPHSLA